MVKLMKILYGLVVLFETLLVGYCGVKTLHKKRKLDKSVCSFEWLTVVCACVFMVYTFSNDKMITLICKGLILSLFDWLIINLLFYTQFYTGAFKGRKELQIGMVIFATIDNVMLVANAWTHSIFEITSITDEHITVCFRHDSFWYQAHYTFTYMCFFLVLFIYLYMILHSAKLYRQGYMVVAAVIGAGIAFDLSTINTDSIYDISMLIYGIMAIMIYYLTYKYVPDKLIENMLSLIVSDMNNGIVCFDSKERCVYYNDIMKKIYRYSDSVATYERLYRKWKNEAGLESFDRKKYETQIEVDGKMRHFEISYRRIFDEKSNFLCDYFIYIDRTEMYEALEEEKYKATHDSLTGLLNRDEFYVQTEALLKKYPDTEFCIICSNIKDFKLVNEIFGIEKGNQVLIRQAELMAHIQSMRAICARMLNDRFAVCIPKEDIDEAEIENMINELKKEFANNAFSLHIYMGIYKIADRHDTVSLMYDRANIAADTIKNSYESCIAHYDEHLLEISIEERHVIGAFDKALENGEFIMYLQPQVDSTGKAHGAEALVRWQHPQRGLLTPYAFVDILENSGLIYKLDHFMWEKAAQKLAEWKKMGKDNYHISVNISTKDFYILDIYDIFINLVEKYDISPSNMNVEITETTLMSDLEKNMVILGRLQRAGFKVEIDDFGSGYSSLNMLKDINADVLKIDMAFLRESENEGKGREILETIITLAGKIGMEVITEGVETVDQLKMLSEMGCNNFQGYYFSKPIPAEEFEKKYFV